MSMRITRTGYALAYKNSVDKVNDFILPLKVFRKRESCIDYRKKMLFDSPLYVPVKVRIVCISEEE